MLLHFTTKVTQFSQNISDRLTACVALVHTDADIDKLTKDVGGLPFISLLLLLYLFFSTFSFSSLSVIEEDCRLEI